MHFNRIKKNYFLTTGLLILLVVLTACRRGDSNDLPDIGLNLAVSPNPPAVGPAVVTLTLTEAGGEPITGATIELEGNMSHAGMAPVFAQATEVEPGHYEAPLEFTMGGDWFILVKASLPGGRKLERQIDLPGVEAH